MDSYLAEQSSQTYEREISKISKAINNAETFEEWIQLAKQAKDYHYKYRINIDELISLISIKVRPGLYKNSISDQKDQILLNLQNLLELQKLEIPVGEIKNVIIEYALRWIEDVNDVKKIKAFKGETVVQDPDTSREILKIINQLEIAEEKTQEKLKKLNELFPVPTEPVPNQPVYITQRSQIIMGPPIFVRSELNVNQCKIMWKGKQIAAVIKTYKEQGGYKSLKKFQKEVGILHKLSGTSRFFLDFYGCFCDEVIENNVIKYCSNIVMEYCQHSLSDLIKSRKDQNTKFTPEELGSIALDLLEAFQSLVNHKIYHQDIKPDNILITKDGQWKIADFNVSGIRETIERTYSATGVHDVIGTVGYMAPELRKAYINGEGKAKYRPERADVFSLGLVLYQCETFDDISRFNENPINREKVLSNVRLPWLRELLYDMLNFNYRERLSFKRALSKVMRDTTATLDSNAT